MTYGCASLVEWGFIIPREKLYPLFKILRELAGKPLDSLDSEAETSQATGETSKGTEEVQGPPATKRELSDEDLDEMLELVDAAIKKADDERAEKEKASKGEAEKEKTDKGSPEDAIEPNLQEIIAPRKVLDKQAGSTIACYYFLEHRSGNRYEADQWGHPEEYELLSVGMGKTLSLQGNEELVERMSHWVREVLRFKEVGIEVEDQWILMLVPM